MLPDPYLGISEVGKLGGGGERTRSTDSSRALRRVHFMSTPMPGSILLSGRGRGEGVEVGNEWKWRRELGSSGA
jgi:hypothetical protein